MFQLINEGQNEGTVDGARRIQAHAGQRKAN